MYTMMVVDDDIHVLRGFIRKIDFEELGVEVIATAEDGKQALEKFKQHRPDIIMSDIRMPIMDGLSLIKAIREIDEHTKIIILSGYAEFDYAKQAMQYGVIDYLLKPTSKPDIVRVTKQIVAQLDEQAAEQTTHLQNQKQALQHQLETALRQDKTGTLLKNKIRDYGLLHTGDTLVTVAVQCRSDMHSADLEQLLSQQLPETKISRHLLLNLDQNTRLIIFSLTSHGSETLQKITIKNMAIAIKNGIKSFTGDVPRIAVGQVANSLSNLDESVAGALNLLRFRSVTPEDVILNPQISAESEISIRLIREVETAANEAKKNSDQEEFLSQIERFFTTLEGLPGWDESVYQEAVMFCFRLLNAFNRSDGAASALNEQDIWDGIQRAGSSEELHEFVGIHARRMLAEQEAASQRDYSAPIKYIINAVAQRYADNIRIKDFAAELFLSETYLTALFKKETGSTYKKYLTDYRITKSKKYLEDPKWKIQEVADKVGFCDEAYFSTTFKNVTGMTPKAYRSMTGFQSGKR